MSCGVRILADIASLEKSPPLLARAISRHEALAFPYSTANHFTYIFSDNVERGNGAWLARFIKDNGLGTLTESPEVRNHNTGYTHIQTWIWNYNGKAIV
jgi:hypothetical protein